MLHIYLVLIASQVLVSVSSLPSISRQGSNIVLDIPIDGSFLVNNIDLIHYLSTLEARFNATIMELATAKAVIETQSQQITSLTARVTALEGVQSKTTSCATQGFLNNNGVCSPPTVQLTIDTNYTCAANTTGILGFSASKNAPTFCDGRNFNPIYKPAYGAGSANPGLNCYDIRTKRSSETLVNGEYWIKPTSGTAFQVYCDMNTNGGGWTFCYTTNVEVHVKTETSSVFAYGTNGYRADCNNIAFNQVIYRREDTKVDAFFAANEPGNTFTMSATDYYTTGAAFGTWTGSGAASANYSYQMGICDSTSSLSPGIWLSGIIDISNTIGCWKACDIWCDEKISYFFRGPTSYAYGSAFAENGNKPVSVKLISVGMRNIPYVSSNLGQSASNAGISCNNIKTTLPLSPDGVYWLKPSNVSTAFLAYCDMTTDGGGWQMCYTTYDKIRVANEVTYSYPYGTAGYRSDCRNSPFNDVLTINHGSSQKAWFKQQSRSVFRPASTDYNTNSSMFGLWTGYGTVSTSYSYQIGICDVVSSYSPGIWISGYTNSCWKACDHWCYDFSSPFFRAETTDQDGKYNGVAFNENGNNFCGCGVTNKLMSVGIRQSA